MKTHYILFSLFLNIILFANISAQGCLDAAIYMGTGSDNMYAFRGDATSVMAWGANSFSAPNDFNDTFFGIEGWNHIDAALEPGNNTILLFSGTEVAFLSKSNNTVLVDPAPMTNYYNFLPAHFQEGLDAAFAWPNGDLQNVFFFKGNEWLRFDWDHATNSISNFDGPHTGSWDGVFTQHFTDGVDAAVYYDETNKVYFFRGNQYIRYDASSGQMDAGYPLPITDNWGNYPADWSCIDVLNNGDCNIGYQLPDDACGPSSSLDFIVTNAPGTAMGSDVVLSGVALYLEHTYVSDLVISLISPSGQEVLLSSLNGGSGDNYGSSCTSPTYFEDGATTPIHSGAAPFAGPYSPQEQLSSFNDGASPNGKWRLQMCDTEDQDVGILQYVELFFSPQVGIEAVEDVHNEMSIYPSPNNGNFTLEWKGAPLKEAMISVLDMTGKTIYETPAQAYTHQPISLDHAPNGVYLVQMRTADRILSKKVVIQQ